MFLKMLSKSSFVVVVLKGSMFREAIPWTLILARRMLQRDNMYFSSKTFLVVLFYRGAILSCPLGGGRESGMQEAKQCQLSLWKNS